LVKVGTTVSAKFVEFMYKIGGVVGV
jgi:hypothetical protein